MTPSGVGAMLFFFCLFALPLCSFFATSTDQPSTPTGTIPPTGSAESSGTCAVLSTTPTTETTDTTPTTTATISTSPTTVPIPPSSGVIVERGIAAETEDFGVLELKEPLQNGDMLRLVIGTGERFIVDFLRGTALRKNDPLAVSALRIVFSKVSIEIKKCSKMKCVSLAFEKVKLPEWANRNWIYADLRVLVTETGFKVNALGLEEAQNFEVPYIIPLEFVERIRITPSPYEEETEIFKRWTAHTEIFKRWTAFENFPNNKSSFQLWSDHTAKYVMLSGRDFVASGERDFVASGERSQAATFIVQWMPEGTVALREASSGKFVRLDMTSDGDSKLVLSDEDEVSVFGRFYMEKWGDVCISLQASANMMYLGVWAEEEEGGNTRAFIRAKGHDVGSWEWFQFEEENKFVLWSNDVGRYVHIDRSVQRPQLVADEFDCFSTVFKLQHFPDGSVSLKADGKYVSIKEGSGELVVSEEVEGDRFTLAKHGDSEESYSMRSITNGKYVTVSRKNDRYELVAASEKADTWDSFKLLRDIRLWSVLNARYVEASEVEPRHEAYLYATWSYRYLPREMAVSMGRERSGDVSLFMHSNDKYVRLEEGDESDNETVLIADSSRKDRQLFTLERKSDVFSLRVKGSSDQYVSVSLENMLVVRSVKEPGPSEAFKDQPVVNLLFLEVDRFVTVDESTPGAPLVASMVKATVNETFTVWMNSDGTISLRAHANNKFVSVSSVDKRPGLSASADAPGGKWESFKVVIHNDTLYPALKCMGNDLFVSVREGDGGQLRAGDKRLSDFSELWLN